FFPAAVIRRAISPSLRYSRARTSALRLRGGGRRRSATVPITEVGATSVRCGFVMIFQGSSSATVPNMGHHGTLHKARNADFMGTTVISRAAAEPVNTQETLNWRAFSVGGQPRPPQDGQQRAADCDSPARFFLRRKRFRL